MRSGFSILSIFEAIGFPAKWHRRNDRSPRQVLNAQRRFAGSLRQRREPEGLPRPERLQPHRCSHDSRRRIGSRCSRDNSCSGGCACSGGCIAFATIAIAVAGGTITATITCTVALAAITTMTGNRLLLSAHKGDRHDREENRDPHHQRSIHPRILHSNERFAGSLTCKEKELFAVTVPFIAPVFGTALEQGCLQE